MHAQQTGSLLHMCEPADASSDWRGKISGGATEDSPCHNKDHFHFNKDHFTLSRVATSENVPY